LVRNARIEPFFGADLNSSMTFKWKSAVPVPGATSVDITEPDAAWGEANTKNMGRFEIFGFSSATAIQGIWSTNAYTVAAMGATSTTTMVSGLVTPYLLLNKMPDNLTPVSGDTVTGVTNGAAKFHKIRSWSIAVTGALTYDGGGVTIGTLPYHSVVNTKPKFQNTAAQPDSCTWSGTYWSLIDGATGAEWRSSDPVSSPDLCTTWVAQGLAAGTPSIALTYQVSLREFSGTTQFQASEQLVVNGTPLTAETAPVTILTKNYFPIANAINILFIDAVAESGKIPFAGRIQLYNSFANSAYVTVNYESTR
jgi:hypothetical protein